MKKRVFIYGCSFSAGIELKNRELSSWPVLFAQKINFELVNRSVGGASNERNLRLLIKDLALENPDFVIFQVTGEQRMELCRNEGEVERFGSALKIATQDKFLNRYIYYKYLNEEFLIKKLLDQVFVVTQLLRETPHKLFFGIAYAEKMRQIHQVYSQYHKNLIPTENIIGWPDESFRIMTEHNFPYGPDDHPLEEAHAYFADYLLKKIDGDHL